MFHTLNFPPHLLRMGIVLASILLVVGLVSPMMTLTQFYFFDNSFSVFSGLTELFSSGQYLLAIVVFLFSVLLPFVKLFLLFKLAGLSADASRAQQKILHLMHDYGRWAMLDVLVVAVLIVTVKLGAVATVEIHWGLYVFAAAIVLIMYLTDRVVKQNKGDEEA